MTTKKEAKAKLPQRRVVASTLRSADIDTYHISMVRHAAGILVTPPDALPEKEKATLLKECRTALVEAGATVRSASGGLLCTSLAAAKRRGSSIPKVLSREDATALVNAPLADMNVSWEDRRYGAARNHVAFYLMRRWGLRESEVCGLTVADVDLEHGYMLVLGKGQKERSFNINAETVALCRWWLAHRATLVPKGSIYFLPTLKGGAWATSDLRQRCRDYSKRTGIFIQDKGGKKPVQPHVFRHCAATELLEDGYALHEVQQILGHSSIAVTSVYLHVRPTAMEEKGRGRPALPSPLLTTPAPDAKEPPVASL